MSNINTSFPDAHDLRCFREIASTLNISRAAEKLGMGQPGLSLSLKRLEKNLGATLFLRRQRGLSLTPAGQRLLSRCNKLEEDWQLLVADTKNAASEVSGIFRFGCHTAVALYALTPFLKEMMTEYPDIEFKLTHGSSATMCEGVITGDLDFAFVINPVQHPDLVIKKIATDEVCLWGVPGYAKDVVIYHPSWEQAEILLKKEITRFDRFLNSNSLEVIASLAEAGVGAAILPTRIAHKLAPSARRLPNSIGLRDEVTFIYRQDHFKSAATAVIIEQAKGLSI